MSYPALYSGGELGIASPSAEPGETVFRTLIDFKREMREAGRSSSRGSRTGATGPSR